MRKVGQWIVDKPLLFCLLFGAAFCSISWLGKSIRGTWTGKPDQWVAVVVVNMIAGALFGAWILRRAAKGKPPIVRSPF